MVPVKQFAVLVAAAALFLCPSVGRSGLPTDSLSLSTQETGASSLFAQSSAQVLLREFNQPEISFLLLDVKTRELLASRWDDPERRIPMGSLIKPFTALAYGEQHEFRYPTHVCKGESTGCWRPTGHGAVDLSSAIANSCNSYFRMLTEDMSAPEVSPTATEFGLDDPDDGLRGASLAGLGTGWSTSPIHMARAYLELAQRRDQPGVNDILAGMARSARTGTGLEVGRALEHSAALVKTGTAACTHPTRAPGDGFVVVLFPANQPEFVLLVRVHRVPGSKAARVAGQMLRRIGE